MPIRCLIFCLFLAGCVKQTPVPTPQNSPDGTVGSVALGPYAYFSPFACNMSATNLTCMATVDVSFLRGQRSYFIPRGYQFTFHTPTGQQGSAGVWFGCAQGNECDGFFMFGSPSVTATPVEPARCWCNSNASINPPYGSIPLFEVDVQDSQFKAIRPKFSGQYAGPFLKAGNGITISCTDLACTVGLK